MESLGGSPHLHQAHTGLKAGLEQREWHLAAWVQRLVAGGHGVKRQAVQGTASSSTFSYGLLWHTLGD